MKKGFPLFDVICNRMGARQREQTDRLSTDFIVISSDDAAGRALLNYHIVGVTGDGIPEPLWHLDWHSYKCRAITLPQGDTTHYQVKNAFLREWGAIRLAV